MDPHFALVASGNPGSRPPSPVRRFASRSAAGHWIQSFERLGFRRWTSCRSISNSESPQPCESSILRPAKPELLCIEAHAKTRQRILDIMTSSSGYVVIGKYLRVDEPNIYFMPLRPS